MRPSCASRSSTARPSRASTGTVRSEALPPGGPKRPTNANVCRHAGAIEKDRRDKEEKKAIAKAKQEMLEIQDQHISDVTRRAIDDNNELQLEIAFQSKQAKELLAQNGAYTANAVQVRGARGSRGAGLRQLCRGTRFGVASADPTRAWPCSCGGTWRFRWTRRKRWRRRTARTRRRAALAPVASWRGAWTRGIIVHPLPRRLRLRAVSVRSCLLVVRVLREWLCLRAAWYGGCARARARVCACSWRLRLV